MEEEIGKWLLDISKYIITAYILSQMFDKDDNSVWTFIGAVTLAAGLLGIGLLLINVAKLVIIRIRKGKGYEHGIIRNVHIFGISCNWCSCLF